MSVEVRAQNTLSMTSVKAIKDATDQSAQLLSEMEQYAEDAGTTLTGIYADAESAKANAETAQTSADTAIRQLDVVENIVGVLNLIATNGTYELTQDTEVVPNKWYFTQSGTAPNYVYTVVQNPSGDPSTQGWYELTSIDEAVKNYVSSHMILDGNGLLLQADGSNARIRISTEVGNEGLILYGTDGNQIAKYGSNTVIGNAQGFHIEMDGTELGFYQGARKVAYISNNQLYITQSVVLQQMDLGTPVNNGGLGQWSWKVHANGETPSRNNLNLKWIG